jgi:hypothetical protein
MTLAVRNLIDQSLPLKDSEKSYIEITLFSRKDAKSQSNIFQLFLASCLVTLRLCAFARQKVHSFLQLIKRLSIKNQTDTSLRQNHSEKSYNETAYILAKTLGRKA